MKKSKLYLLILVILTAVAIYFIIGRTNTTIKEGLKDFAVRDTSSVVKIFLANKSNDQVTLDRISRGEWMVNGKFKVRKDLINILLETICDVEALAPVAKHAHNNIIKMMAASSTKVEVYVKKYRIKLFNKIFLFPSIKLEKVYYVGSPTQDKFGTFMLIEGSKIPFITYIRGFRGYLSPRYSAKLSEWRDKSLFSYYINDIKSVTVKPEDEKEAFEINKVAQSKYQLKSLFKNETVSTDTTLVLDFLTSFYQINFEYFTDYLTKKEIDSIIKTKPYFDITITDNASKSKNIKTYRIKAFQGYEMDPKRKFMEQYYDPDRLYAFVNNKDFVVIQYFVFDRIFRTLSDFVKTKKPAK